MSEPYRVSFVCTGNICRSPMGEVILRGMLADAGLGERVVVDSCGTGEWHVGQPAQPFAIEVLADAGYDGTPHRAQQLSPAFVTDRDLLLALDKGHLRWLKKLSRKARGTTELRMLREFDSAAVNARTLEVDDPYSGTGADYERARDEIERSCRGLTTWLTEQLTPA